MPVDPPTLAIPARQDRSRRVQRRIVECARTLFSERPYESVTIADVAACAGVAVGSIYRRFESKERLLLFLAREVVLPDLLASVRRALAPGRWEDAPVTDVIAAYVTLTIRSFRRYRAILRPVALLSRLSQEPELRAMVAEFNREAHGRFLALLRERRDEIRHPDPERAAALGLAWISAVLRELVLFEEPVSALGRAAGGGTLGDRELARQLTWGLVAYLRSPAFDGDAS